MEGGKVFLSASGAMGEGCDPIIILTFRTAAMFCGNGLYTETMVVQPPSQTDTALWRQFVHENRGGPTPVAD
jgi:hypothetical protein